MGGEKKANFEWDDVKNRENMQKHGVSFEEAQLAFLDPNRLVYEDITHSTDEQRYFCFGRVEEEVMTVRFTYRNEKVRIFGAGRWRKGKKEYDEVNS